MKSSSAWEQISREIIVKCFRRSGFNYHEEESEECEEDTGLNKVIRSLLLDFQKDLVYADEMECGDADIIHEKVTSTPDEVLEEIFQKMEEQPVIEDLNCENGDSDDDNDIVSTEHVRPRPTHKDTLQCVSQLITYSSAHQPQFMGDLFHLYNSIEAQWIAAQMTTRQKKNQQIFLQ
jgi:hypothetical protein